MSQAGLVDQIKRGHYRLSEDGAKLLATDPSQLNTEYLKRYPKFLEFLDRSSNSKQDQGADTREPAAKSMASSVEQDLTPEDIITQNMSTIDRVLREDVLSAVLSVSPTRFEQLIVDLLVAMGYGGGDPEMGESIGKSGDGGIDGIINEDSLGLDAVYVQAKRYDPAHKVGRPDIQKFVGSLTGESATKGVFVTTSDFSREAWGYVDRVQQRIVLINGEQLARLMIQHGVGVRVRKTYLIRSVDEDYFSDT
jgi:restriction system protein